MNQFKYSLDNKRYHTYNYYLKNKYHQKVAKVALNADFTCPNRDGTKGYGGCIFCVHQDLEIMLEMFMIIRKTISNNLSSYEKKMA